MLGDDNLLPWHEVPADHRWDRFTSNSVLMAIDQAHQMKDIDVLAKAGQAFVPQAALAARARCSQIYRKT